MESKILISILIPVYNNMESLPILIEKLEKELNHKFYRYELVIINDGSSDSNYLNLDFKKFLIKLIQLEKNYGQVPAIMIGLKYVNGNSCVIMAADLQEPVHIINELTQKWSKNSGLVIAYRESRNDKNKTVFLSIIFNLLLSIFRKKMPKSGFDFCIVDLVIINKIIQLNPYTCYLQIKLTDFADSIISIPYVRNKSYYKKSSWTFFKKISYANNAFFTIDKYFYVKTIIFISLIIVSFIFSFDDKINIFFIPILIFSILTVLLMWGDIMIKQKKEHPKIGKLVNLNHI